MMATLRQGAAPLKHIIGNWKMHGDLACCRSLAAAVARAAAALPPRVRVAVCPPVPYLAAVREALGDGAVMLGAQHLSGHGGEGAHTGEYSAAMLADLGCSLALVGHSERRAAGMDGAQTVACVRAALDAGIRPVLCVGESLEARAAGDTLEVLRLQLAPVLAALGGDRAGLMVAYEPVWAIGSGRSAAADEVRQVHSWLHETLGDGVPVLYGGSLSAANAAALMAVAGVDGGLVGGAALDADKFMAVCRAAATGG